MSNLNMQKETDSDIFEIPTDVIFPLELSRHLKNKLTIAMDENWQLKQHIHFQTNELSQLQKYKTENEETKDFSQPLLATKLVEVNRKNRDMTARMESMKSKMQKLMDDNEQLKEQIQDLEKSSTRVDEQSLDMSFISSSVKTDEEILSSTHELNLVNSKMMQYRRQCQQLRIELRTALRALAQEVGDGVTPQTVLSVVNNNSCTWRGRQQQIISLNQKLADSQIKLLQYKQSSQQHIMGAGGEGDNCSESGTSGVNLSKETNCEDFKTVLSCLPLSVSQKNLNGLQQQERKKHENLEKITQEFETTKTELKSLQLEIKASKARTQTLEGQIRTYRLQIDDLNTKYGQKEIELNSNMNELVQFKHDFMTLKEREKKLRENNTTEIRECQQALNRERTVVIRLQDIIEKKQVSVEKLEGEVARLQSNLDSCCSASPYGGQESENRIKILEDQLTKAAQAIDELEKERQRLMSSISDSINRAGDERIRHSNSQRHLLKSFEVLQRADSCINQCLEIAQITSKNILQEVESIRSLMRELKTGSLFSLESVQIEDVRKLKSHVNIMTKEISILQFHLQKSTEERRLDLQQFSNLADKMRNELFCVIHTAINSFRVRNF